MTTLVISNEKMTDIMKIRSGEGTIRVGQDF